MSLQTAKIEVPKASTLSPPSPAKRRWGAPLNAPIQDWRGRRVWLVGASSGIGLACAKALHAAGAHVLVAGSAVFKAGNEAGYKREIAAIRQAAQAAQI